MPNATFRCPRRRLTRRSCRLHSRSPGSPGKHPPLLMRCLRPRMRHLARLCASQAAPASSMPTSHSRLCRLVKAVHVLSMHEGCAKLIQGRWTSWARSRCSARQKCNAFSLRRCHPVPMGFSAAKGLPCWAIAGSRVDGTVAGQGWPEVRAH